MVAPTNEELFAISFALDLMKQRFYYRLPCRAEGVLERLRRDGAGPKFCTMEHARDVGWRIVKGWIEAQFAMIDAGNSDMGEIFLSYLVIGPNETIYQRFIAGGGMLALPAAKEA